MNDSSTGLLKDPGSCGHIVYSYMEDGQAEHAVCLFASAGLRKGEAVILVMANEHCRQIRRFLQEEGFDLGSLERAGLLVCKDAEALLSTFLRDGIVDEQVFKLNVGGLIDKAKATGGNRPRRPVRVFGEMVDLLWRTNPAATQRLEELWNEVIAAHQVPLLCAYGVAGVLPGVFPEALIACHSHVIA